MQKNFFAFVAFFVFIFSCKKENDSQYKMINRGEEVFKVKKSQIHIDDNTYTAYRLPSEIFVEEDTLVKNNLQKELVVGFEFKNDTEDLLGENLTGKDLENTIKYLSFQIQNDFKIVNSEGDTLSCLGAHFERTYKVTPFKRVLLYFNGVSEGEDVRLVYNDKLYKKGIMDFNLGNKPVKL